MNFHVTTTGLANNTTVISVVGEADLNTAPMIKGALHRAIDDGASSIIVDLTATTFIDSTTLGVLVGGLRRLRTNGGRIVVLCLDPNIRKIFEITLLDRVFPLVDSLDAARDELDHAAAAH